MPFYEYECTKCHFHTEVLQKISDPPITKCDNCKGKMKKLISQSTFHLKGSGWYVTDYASKTGGNDGKSSAGDASSTGSETAKETKSSSSDTTSKKKETKVAKAKD